MPFPQAPLPQIVIGGFSLLFKWIWTKEMDARRAGKYGHQKERPGV